MIPQQLSKVLGFAAASELELILENYYLWVFSYYSLIFCESA